MISPTDYFLPAMLPASRKMIRICRYDWNSACFERVLCATDEWMIDKRWSVDKVIYHSFVEDRHSLSLIRNAETANILKTVYKYKNAYSTFDALFSNLTCSFYANCDGYIKWLQSFLHIHVEICHICHSNEANQELKSKQHPKQQQEKKTEMRWINREMARSIVNATTFCWCSKLVSSMYNCNAIKEETDRNTKNSLSYRENHWK